MEEGEEEVNISAIIGFMGLLVTVVFQGLYVAYKMGKLEQKLTTLEEKQDKHNHIVEITYCNKQDIAVLKEQIKVENHRIDDLETTQHECILHKGK